MKLINRIDDPSQDDERARSYLLQYEAYHGLMLGLLDAIKNYLFHLLY